MSRGLDLAGRVALVTGGGRGIGRAVTEELARLGARVVIADSGVSMGGHEPDPTLAESLAKELGGAAYSGDVAAPGAAQAIVDLALTRFGSVDIVVNAAAILRDALIFKAERANWDQVIETNLSGAFAVLAAATPHMREGVKAGRSPGRIVNIISTAGLYGNFGQAAYASAKAGLVGLTRVVAMDMARSKVNCNAVAPFAATRVTESIQPANDAQATYKTRALTIPAAYVARLVAYLCSPACEATGQVFGVRGREVFLFSQPRPVARLVTPALPELTLESLDAAISIQMRDAFTDLTTDLEAFNSEPIL
jgi:NAD(P)-dependent dehydrogenase (short-subunit alcohol dehydrogenase family)